MNKIKLSTIFELDNLINSSEEFDSIESNWELFQYVKHIVDYINEMYFELSVDFLSDKLTGYLERFLSYPKEEFSKYVFEDDYNFINGILEDLRNALNGDIQKSYCYIIDDPQRDRNFEVRLEEVLKNAMDYEGLSEYFVGINLRDSQKAFAFGLYNASAIYLSIATESYTRFFYTSLNNKEYTKHEDLNWTEVIYSLNELQRTTHFPKNILRDLKEIKNNVRNKILHDGKQLEDDETKKYIDLCFESIMEMNNILKKYQVPKSSNL